MSALLIIFVIAILCYLAATVFEGLHRRLKRVEGRLLSFLGEIQKRLGIESNRVLAPEELAERIADGLTRRIPPPLERVIFLTVWMTREFMKKVLGLADTEIEELRDLIVADAHPSGLPGGRFEIRRRVEQWTTHTVVFDVKDFKKNTSGYLSTSYWLPGPTELWSHAFGTQASGLAVGDVLQLVLHDNRIKFCKDSVGGASVVALWVPFTPCEGNTFISIPPLDKGDLRQYPSSTEHSQMDQSGFGGAFRIQDIAPAPGRGR